jgi:hypothetical protein
LDVNMFTGGHSMTVGGQPATKTGRRSYQLPTADGGTVEATVRPTFFDVHPAVNIGGVRHRLGPATPVWLRVVMLLPIVLLAGGALGIFIGLMAILVNATILRASVSTAVKVLLMIGILVVATVVWLIVAAVVHSALS